MKIDIQNIQEISPIILLSVLLFVSCTQLPVEETNVETNANSNVEEIINADVVESAEMDAAIVSEAEVMLPRIETISDIDMPDFEGDLGNAVENESSIADAGETGREINAGSLEPGLEKADQEVFSPDMNDENLPATEELARITEEIRIHQRNVERLCEEIGNKLGSVSVEDCLIQELEYAGAYSVNARPLAMRDFHPSSIADSENRILIMGGIHGDEYSSISIMFKWMTLLQEKGGDDYRWRFLPAVNPDGLLDGQAVRQNASGVDLNRNFPSQDWDATALEYWRNNTGENPRRYPGNEAASEPEVRWIIEQIENFNPAVIVSVHAPYHLLDFDGPLQAPDKIGDLYLHQLGVYPGSLGNYAGLDLGIPVVTLELPSAGIMPSVEQIETMWNDMLLWLNTRSQHEQRASL
jgi:protein MpaA